MNQIEKLRAERDQKMRELEEKVAVGGDDGEKNILADRINEISDELERLGNSDDITPT